MNDLTLLLSRGGITIYPILACSILALTIFLERIKTLNENKLIPGNLKAVVFSLINNGESEKLTKELNSNTSPLAGIYKKMIEKIDAPVFLLKEAIEEQGKHEAVALEKHLGALSTIASVAPLLGILGTVLGMISAFQAVSESGYASPLDMASGVWEALLSTAFGLSVGIFALVTHKFLQGKVDKIVLSLEKESLELFELLRKKNSEQ